ncbi:MAG: hypothetical protein JHC93_04745 [Parachlamydiales bacterium]|nr:hypothetical protein [Parachlamydiales bacterium]
MSVTLSSLPPEIFYAICSKLNLNDIAVFSRVDRRCYTYINCFSHYWKPIWLKCSNTNPSINDESDFYKKNLNTAHRIAKMVIKGLLQGNIFNIPPHCANIEESPQLTGEYSLVENYAKKTKIVLCMEGHYVTQMASQQTVYYILNIKDNKQPQTLLKEIIIDTNENLSLSF